MSRKKRESFIFYDSFFEAFRELQDKNQLELYQSIANYSLNFIEPKLEGISKTIWILIKPQLDANIKKYKNGSLGGRPKDNLSETETEPRNNQKITETKPGTNQIETKQEANANVNVNVNPNVNVTPPFSEIEIFTKELNQKHSKNMSAKIFENKMKSQDWKTKDWKATAEIYCLQNWAKLEEQSSSSSELQTTPHALYYFESDGDKIRIKGRFISKKTAWLERSKVGELGYKLEFDKFLIDYEDGFKIGTRDEKAKKILVAALKHCKLSEGASWEDIKKITINC